MALLEVEGGQFGLAHHRASALEIIAASGQEPEEQAVD